MITVRRPPPGHRAIREQRSQRDSAAHLLSPRAVTRTRYAGEPSPLVLRDSTAPRRGREPGLLAFPDSWPLSSPSLHGEAFPSVQPEGNAHYSHSTVCVLRIYNRVYRCHITVIHLLLTDVTPIHFIRKKFLAGKDGFF